MSKENEINKFIELVTEFLAFLRPEKKWEITYGVPNNCIKHFGEWNTKYFGLIDNEEYIFFYEKEHLLYAINVSGNSTLCTASEIMNLLMNKF